MGMVGGFTELTEKVCLPNALMRTKSQMENRLDFHHGLPVENEDFCKYYRTFAFKENDFSQVHSKGRIGKGVVYQRPFYAKKRVYGGII